MCLLALFVVSLVDQCGAPLQLADPPKGGKLVQLQVLIRHGARAPGTDFLDSGNMYEWHCDETDSIAPRYNPAPVLHPRSYRDALDPRLVQYKPSCRTRDLTLLGMQQHEELGKLYRQRYVDDLKVLPENYDPEVIYLRATEEDRTLKSAIAFVQGMFPPASDDEVVQIVTDTAASGLLHPKTAWCRELEGMTAHMINSSWIQSKWSDFSARHQTKIEHLFKIWEISHVKKMCSWLSLMRCAGHAIDPLIDEDIQADCRDILSYWHFGVGRQGKYYGALSAPLYREMFRIADEAISLGSRTKFVLLSSHDTACAAFLTTLGWPFLDKPGMPVRSHIAFELWEIENEIYARYVFNGVPVNVSFLDNKSLFTYGSLKSRMAQEGILNHCFVPEWK